MRHWLPAVGLLGAALLLPPGAAGRTVPVTVTVRGIAAGVSAGGFTLVSPSKGRFRVTVTRDTELLEIGSSGRLTVRNGDHVGVRGLLRGRSIAAITVRIYPVAPKPYSVKGTVRSMAPSTIVIVAGKTVITATLTVGTTVTIGTRTGRVREVRAGDRVLVRLLPGSGRPSVQHIHVYRSRQPLRHLKLKGTVVAIDPSVVTVRTGGKEVAVRLTAATRTYAGNTRATRTAIRQGARVTVYACCAGRPLTATSIHVSVTVTPVPTRFIRGSVVALSAHGLTLTSGSTSLPIRFIRTTRFELGPRRVSWSAVRVGDYISVRAVVRGSALQARTVHVYLEYRRVRTLRGTVSGTTAATLRLRYRGKTIPIAVSPTTPIRRGRTAIRLSSLRPGERVAVRARLRAPGAYSALAVDAAVVVPPSLTVRGTVTAVRGGRLEVRDTRGKRYTLVLPRSVRPTLTGRPASPDMLFPGVTVTARGLKTGSVVRLTSLALHLTLRSLKGRIVAVDARSVRIRVGSATVRVGLAPTTTVSDAGRRVSVRGVFPEAYARVRAYEASPAVLRAVTIVILHPTLDVPVRIVATSPALRVSTATGDAYTLTLTSATTVTVSPSGIPLKRQEILAGARAHLTGTVRSDGTVQVTSLALRLRSVSLRGTVTVGAGGGLTVASGSQEISVRLSSATSFWQGSRPIARGDLVSGDDITVEGYILTPALILARKVLVHRRLLGETGQVTAVATDGFTLQGADGPHPVIPSAATVWTGTSLAALSVGLTVHVTAYLRGDGALLATRIRLGK